MTGLRKKWFMLNKLLRDVKNPGNRYVIAEEVHRQSLREYYFIFEEQRIAAGKDQALINKFDENGIPINKTYIDVTDKDYVYFPISIGQMGLSVYHTYLKTGSDEDKNRFLKFAEWFQTNAEITEKQGARWLTDVALPQYRNSGPWTSAFAQGRGISILLRGYQITGNEDYAGTAKAALRSFELPVEKGGVTAFTKWGPFYEEYTADVPTLVLNGMIFAMYGLYDFIRVFPDDIQAKKLFDDGIATLKKILPRFDLGFWSRYNLCDAPWYPVDPSTILYQNLHITQLQVMARITGDPFFNEYAEIFEKQLKKQNILRAYVLKYKALRKLKRV